MNKMIKHLSSTGRVFDNLPFEILDANEEVEMSQFVKNYVFVGPKKYCLPHQYKECGLDIYNFQARSDDVYLVGYPRTGTTLHCEMIWQIAHNLDFDAKDFLQYRFPHVDYGFYSARSKIKDMKPDYVDEELNNVIRKYQEVSLEGVAQQKDRRFLRSHMPLSLMSPSIFDIGAKVIYCARNPKDVLVSFQSLFKFFSDINLDMKTLFNIFKNNFGAFCPYFEHVKEAWEKRNEDHFLFLFYEDTIKDKRQTIRKVADFLGKDLTEDQIGRLEDHLNIENFRSNKAVNCDQLIKLGLAHDNGRFIGKGGSGGWRELFDEELNEQVDLWIKENLKGTDLRFPDI